MVEQVINQSLIQQITEISKKLGVSFGQACQMLVENGVSFHHESMDEKAEPPQTIN